MSSEENLFFDASELAKLEGHVPEGGSSIKDKMYAKLAQEYPQVAFIEIDYSGNGDEGYVDKIGAYSSEDGYNIKDPISLAKDMKELIEDYVYDRLPGGWQDNNGSYGICRIDVINRKAEFDHEWRVVTTEDGSFED